jgi:hypothetical protein
MHIRGIFNTEADALSRHAWSATDWRLDSSLLRRILREWHCEIAVDLFASRENTQVRRYFS